MRLKRTFSNIFKGFWQGIGKGIGALVIAFLLTLIPSVRKAVSQVFGYFSVDPRKGIRPLLIFAGTVLIFAFYLRLRKTHSKTKPVEQRTLVPETVPRKLEVHDAIYTSRDKRPGRPTSMAFHVLKWFYNLGPRSTGNVAVVSMQCEISQEEALACVKELWLEGYIYTAIQRPGEWNGEYAITLPGRECVERFGT